MCALYTGEGGRRRERVLWLQHGHYWLFLCSVRLVDASAGASLRAALERTSNHLAWSSASWALKSKVCWAWLSRSACLTSDFSPAGGGAALTSKPGRGITRAPLESYRNTKNKSVRSSSLNWVSLWREEEGYCTASDSLSPQLEGNILHQACIVNHLPSPSFFLYNQEMLVHLLLILIFGTAAFCSGIGILVLEMKPGEALTGWLPFCAIRSEWQRITASREKLSKHGSLFLSNHVNHCLDATPWDVLCRFNATYSTQPRFQGIQRVASSGQCKLKPCHRRQRLYLRSDSGQPNPPGPNLQSADSAQTAWHRQDWTDLIHTSSLMCTGATLCRCPASKGGSGQDVQKGQTGATRGSADRRDDWCGHVGTTCALFVVHFLVQRLTEQAAHMHKDTCTASDDY